MNGGVFEWKWLEGTRMSQWNECNEQWNGKWNEWKQCEWTVNEVSCEWRGMTWVKWKLTNE